MKADLRQTNDYCASFNQYLFDLLSKLADKSTEQAAEVERLRFMLHEQGREIDFLKQENKQQKKRLSQLEELIEEECQARKNDFQSFVVSMETEIHERIINDRRTMVVVDDDRYAAKSNLEKLREDLEDENLRLRNYLCAPMSVYFNAYRDNAYNRGGEEILKYSGVTLNAGGAISPSTGVFTCPVPGTYLFIVNLATHKEKKALISLRKQKPGFAPQDVAAIIAQHNTQEREQGQRAGAKVDRSHMMGQSVLLDLEDGDEVYVYAYTGTWTADWPHNHFTQFLGILLRPDYNRWDGPPRRREDQE